MNDKLIYGKQPLTGIVSIETKDGEATLFLNDGSTKTLPNRYWMLAPSNFDGSWVRMKGDLYYKYGKQFSTREDFTQARRKFRGRETYSIYDQKESFMVNFGYSYFKGLKPSDVSILSFDIESTSLDPEDKEAKVLIISNTFRDTSGNVTRKVFCYDAFETEKDLLLAWCEWVCSKDPSVLCGHNIFSYDLRYLNSLANKWGIFLHLGRDKSPLVFDSFESKMRKDATQFYHYKKAHIYGREIIDTMFLAIKWDTARDLPSYRLKEIISHLNLERPGRTFYDASTIRYKYKDTTEWHKIVEYCKDDSDDALALYDKMIAPFFYMAQTVPKSFQEMICSASGSQLNSIMCRAYLQDGHSLPRHTESSHYEGAISLGNPGVYKNVFKVDVAALYPSIMRHWKVYDPKKDPNGYMLEVVETLTKERLKNKKLAKETGDEYYEGLQSSQKIAINSLYGFMGATGLLFNSPENAAFVTAKGREIITQAMKWAEERNFTLVNCDTDSISFCKRDMSDITKEERASLLSELNSNFPELIRFEDDGYYLSVLVLKAKNYALWDGKKLKVKGSALRASNREPALKEMLDEVIWSFISSDKNITDIYHKYILEACNIKDIKRWASKKTLTEKVFTSERTNETKIKDAVENTEYVEGDKVYVFFKSDDTLDLIERFNGDYSKSKMIEKVFTTMKIFNTVLDISTFFNYKLKKNRIALEELCNGGYQQSS